MTNETRVVPVEMTDEMREAFWEAHDDFEDGRGTAPDCYWRALLAASPQPAGGGGDEARDVEQLDGLCIENDGCPTEGAVLKREWRRLTAMLKATSVDAARLAAYDELLLAVGNKCLGETRHQTALRYLRQAESQRIRLTEQTGMSADYGNDNA